MGRMVEKAALERGHEVVSRIDAENQDDFNGEAFRKADVAIEFTGPSTAVDNILRAFAAGVPVVCGSTGWLNALPPLKDMCEKGAGTLFLASNFSIGVAIFRAVNKMLAGVASRFPGYTPELTEVHHIHKLDHPSGTAITVAEDIIEATDTIGSWKEPAEGDDLPDGVLPIKARREGETVGIHSVCWQSPVDKITLTHEAFSRQGFAEGAVMAAEWITDGKRKGFFGMGDMLGDLTHNKNLFA